MCKAVLNHKKDEKGSWRSKFLHNNKIKRISLTISFSSFVATYEKKFMHYKKIWHYTPQDIIMIVELERDKWYLYAKWMAINDSVEWYWFILTELNKKTSFVIKIIHDEHQIFMQEILGVEHIGLQFLF